MIVFEQLSKFKNKNETFQSLGQNWNLPENLGVFL